MLSCLNELLPVSCLDRMETLKPSVPLLKPLCGVRVCIVTWVFTARLGSAPTGQSQEQSSLPYCCKQCSKEFARLEIALTFWECWTIHLPSLLKSQTLATWYLAGFPQYYSDVRKKQKHSDKIKFKTKLCFLRELPNFNCWISCSYLFKNRVNFGRHWRTSLQILLYLNWAFWVGKAASVYRSWLPILCRFNYVTLFRRCLWILWIETECLDMNTKYI